MKRFTKMLTGLLVLVLLFSSPNALRGMGRNARLSPQDTTFLYLPAVSYELPDLPLQMYATLGVSNDTPHMAYTWGYLLNTATEPLYDATLRVTVMRIEKKLLRSSDRDLYRHLYAEASFHINVTRPTQSVLLYIAVKQGN